MLLCETCLYVKIGILEYKLAALTYLATMPLTFNVIWELPGELG